jgi:two-component system sensor histidine kinase ChvG
MPSKRSTVSDIDTGKHEPFVRVGMTPEGPLRPRRFAALAWRIILFNGFALAILIGGVLYVQSSRVGLVDERLNSIKAQAEIVAGTLAEYATDENTHSIKVDDAEPLLRQLIAPTRLRGRLYLPDGKLAIDTRNLLARNVVQMQELPPLDRRSRYVLELRRLYESVMGIRPFSRLEPNFEASTDGRAYREVTRALSGEAAVAERINEENKLVLSVAVPVQRFKAIYGVLLVSTEGGDIDNVLREERTKLLEVFLVAVGVMVISSLYLSGFIAGPIRRLARAADAVRGGRSGREPIPALAERQDEIGDLSRSLSAMTRALYERIDAIEAFAADVAHELKNPLTSLGSAVEMLKRAGSEEARENLSAIVRNDVRRIDRLITDISDASRLDAELSRESGEPVSVGHLLETIVEVYRATEISRGVTIDLAIDLPPGTNVIGRDERLGQVIRNLVDNAISFSPKGATVTVRSRTEGRSVRIIVEDEGPGVPPENLETIFERFYTERPQGREFGSNSGLGLSIARQIVQRAGGRIWAENRLGPVEGKGARFIVELPMARAQ